MKEDTNTVKKDTESIKGVATDIKKDTDSLKKIINEGQQALEKNLALIKEHVTKKFVENTERNNLADPKEWSFVELYLIGFYFALNVMNSGCQKFGDD